MAIQFTPEKFPDERRSDPKRRAEAAVFDALTAIRRSGYGIYEMRLRPKGQQVDYAVWVDGLGRFAIQVKGGVYRRDDRGNWYLRTYDGEWEPKRSPVQETVDGRLEMHDAISRAVSFYGFVGGVLIFPDMERDPDMERLAGNTDDVGIGWGVDHLEQDLERIAETVGFRRPPTPAHSQNEQEQVFKLMWKGPDRPDDNRPGDDRPDDGRPDDGRPDDGRPDDGRPDDGRPGDGRAVPNEEVAADVARKAQRGLAIRNATFHIPHVEHLHVEFPYTPE